MHPKDTALALVRRRSAVGAPLARHALRTRTVSTTPTLVRRILLRQTLIGATLVCPTLASVTLTALTVV